LHWYFLKVYQISDVSLAADLDQAFWGTVKWVRTKKITSWHKVVCDNLWTSHKSR